MNIFKRELRAGLKTFIFWTVGLFVLVFIGIIKYQGLSSSGSSMSELVATFPRIAQAVMGIVGVDINTLGGYTAILTYYVLLCVVIYAVHLGSAAVTRESVDNTYEFVFTKPCSRARVLTAKLAAAWIYLVLFCIFNIIFSMTAVAYLRTTETMTTQIIHFTLSVFVIGSLYISLSSFIAAASKHPDKGALYGNLAFLYAFILGVIYNMMETPGILKLISPLSYFVPADLAANRFDLLYCGITAILVAVFLYGAYRVFSNKDLT